MARTRGVGLLSCSLPLFECHVDACAALTCPSATRRVAYSRTFQSQHGSSCIAAARWFEVTAIYVPGVIVIVISSWVPGVLEAKSWGTHVRLGTTVDDAGCPSMLLRVAR